MTKKGHQNFFIDRMKIFWLKS